MQISSDSAENEFFTAAMKILSDARIPFLVGGAFALRAYTGIIRDTKDFDVMLLPADIDRALAAFRAAGYRAEMTFTHWLAKVHHGELFIDLICSSGNGVCPVDEDWLRHARSTSMFGAEVRLCPPEEIIWQKAYIMERERFDGSDIAHLILKCSAEIDWDRLILRFGSDWKILYAHLVLFGYIFPSQKDLVPRVILDEFSRRLREEPPGETNGPLVCQGTLVSRAQYLPDIERWGYTDIRTTGRCLMTPAQIEAWTAAIEGRAFRG